MSKFLKKKFPKKLIIWGGIHVTVDPESAIKYADVICLGEAEETILELMQMVSKKKFTPNILGTWFKIRSRVIKNSQRPLEENLDKYPYQDYEASHMYIIKDGRIVQVTEEMLKEILHLPAGMQKYFGLKTSDNYQYLTLTSRGCPFHCSYCCNNVYRRLYGEKVKWLRSRSKQHVLGELVQFIKKHDYINFISFFDDDFLARPDQFIMDFFDEYDRRVNLPFKCNLSAYSVNKAKLKRLFKSGLTNVEVGLQSGSERVHKDVYKRPFNPEKFMDSARILAKFPIIKYYDVILDNPYETQEDISKTIRFLAKMPKPYRLSCFSPTFFPGTELYDQAVIDRLVDPKNLRPIADKKNNALYLNNAYSKALIFLSGRTAPELSFIYSIAAHPILLKAFSWPIMDLFFKKIFELVVQSRKLLR